jgi:hypothetical protein
VNDAPRYSIPKSRKVILKILGLLKDLGLHDIGALMGGPQLPFERYQALLVDKILDRPTDHIRMFRGDIAEREEGLAFEDFQQSRREAIRSILDPYIEYEVTSEILRDIAIIISGNLDSLRRGEPFIRWDGTGHSWAPLYVKKCHRITSRRKRMYAFTVKSYGGATAASDWISVASSGRLHQMIVEAGLAKYKKYIPEDLAGLWFTARLEHSNKGLQYGDIFGTSSMVKNNKELAVRRSKKCEGPYVPLRGRKCAFCPAGRDICRNARLETTWVKKSCPLGHIGYFDPDNPKMTYCLACVRTGEWVKDTGAR